jgi:hypothetical protein
MQSPHDIDLRRFDASPAGAGNARVLAAKLSRRRLVPTGLLGGGA